MRLRVTGMALLLALGGCGGQVPSSTNDAGAVREGTPVNDGKAECAIDGVADWTRDCQVERMGDMLTIRHPDGGFRRLRVLADGRGLEAADGAEPAMLKILDDKGIEVSLGNDRYRLPARIARSGR